MQTKSLEFWSLVVRLFWLEVLFYTFVETVNCSMDSA